ncbi:hypothetical protein AAEX28_07355 [Lentisphaerota bacterium WC36G]|nr:hypothetical protein LJT99_10215 [Lentisphaerae bacterium WC36]
MNKSIYLDMNIFLCLKKKEEFHNEVMDKIKFLKGQGFIFPYSPAHMEEIAIPLRDRFTRDIIKNISFVDKELQLIANISDNWEFLPGNMREEDVYNLFEANNNTYSNSFLPSQEKLMFEEYLRDLPFIIKYHGEDIFKTQLKQEHPKECMKRVIEQYPKTQFAEDNDTLILGRKNDNVLEKTVKMLDLDSNYNYYLERTHDKVRKKYNIFPEVINNISPWELLSDNNIKNLFNDRFNGTLDNLSIENVKNHYRKCDVFSIFFNCLEEAGYKAEKIKYDKKKNELTKIKSRMHDVTHAIYGFEANYFISDDSRFIDKFKVLANFFESDIKIMSIEEFLAFDFV